MVDGNIVENPSYIAAAASFADILSLNESGAMTIFIGRHFLIDLIIFIVKEST